MIRYNTAAGYPRVVPVMGYADVDRAIAWLGNTFGFVETLRATDAQGQTVWAELDMGGGVIMIQKAPVSCSDLQSVRRHSARRRVVVFVDDVPAHHARVADASRRWVSDPEEKPEGVLEYDVEDHEGHLWTFAQFVREVDPEAWGATVPAPGRS